MLEAGVLDHWLPEYAGSTKLRALAAREEKADALRRLAAILPVDADATAIGKRLKLSTQESVRLQLMLDPANAIDTANLRASLYRLGTKLFIDRVAARRARRLARRAGARRQLDAAGTADRRQRCAGAGPEARSQGRRADRSGRALVDRRRLFRRPRRLPRRAEAARRCSKPSVTFVLWLAIALFIVVNDVVGDTWIAATLTVRTVEWYKVLVPLPYVAMLAIIHARRTAGPRWFEAALLAALLWPVSTVLVDFLYVRLTYEAEPAAFFDRFGGPYPLLIGGLFVLPLARWSGDGWSRATARSS